MTNNETIAVLYDGDCPLCTREARWWERLDRGRGQVELVDIAAPDFDANQYGLTHDEVMAQIHAILPDGRVITGMEVFRRVYAALGWGWLVAPTGWWPLKPIFDALYRWFARNRLRLTGRSDCEGACDVPDQRSASTIQKRETNVHDTNHDDERGGVLGERTADVHR
jgi:predicted DCC family thiol-disulfide oxidoreductase YuxK